MSLAADAAAVLTRDEVKRIQFSCEGHVVSPAGLADVARAMAGGLIDVVVGCTGKLLSAAYTPGLDRMTLKSNSVPNTASGQASIVHESVHALVDLRKWTKMTVLTDEAIAYLSEVIYLRAVHTWVSGESQTLAIYNAADTLARAKNLYQIAQRDEKISSKELEPIRQALKAHAAYSSIKETTLTGADGVT